MDNVIDKGLWFVPVEDVLVHDASVSEVWEAGGMETGGDWQSSRKDMAWGHAEGDQDVDEWYPHGGNQEGGYGVPKVEPAAVLGVLLHGGEEGVRQKWRRSTIEAGHSPLLPCIVAGDDATEEEEGDGEDAEEAEVGDEDGKSEGSGYRGEGEVREKWQPVRDRRQLLQKPHCLTFSGCLWNWDEGGRDCTKRDHMMFWTPPSQHQNVNIHQKLCCGLRKGFQILVGGSEGVVSLKVVAEDTLEKLGERQDGEEGDSDGKRAEENHPDLLLWITFL